MKTTIEIPDALLAQAKAKAAREKTTLRALVTAGLAHVIQAPQRRRKPRLRTVTFKGKGLHPDLGAYNWDKIRDMIYEGRGA
jgi:hypothetical protein